MSLAVALASVVTYVSVRAQLRDSVDDGLRSLASRVNTAPLPSDETSAPRRLNVDELRRRNFLLLLPSSPLGEQAGYAQVVSSAGRIQPPQGQPARLAAGPRVIAVAQGTRGAVLLRLRAVRHAGARVRLPFADGQALQAARSLEEVNSTMRRLAAVLAVVSLAGVGLAALLGGFVGRSALRPVRRLMRGTRYVAATQDLSRRVEAVGDDELAGLARSFNSMLESLAESRRAQRQLIADASHELRTPLTTVQANVELLSRAAELPPEERAQLREDLLSQLRELTALVGDLVELAREHPPEADLEELELDVLVAGCVERIRARGNGVELQCALAPCRVKGDRVRLERAVMNLLDNARKWSPPGSSVTSRSPTARSSSATRARASTRPTSRTCSTASTARPTPAASRAPASAWRSSARWRRCTAAPSGRRRRSTAREPNCTCSSLSSRPWTISSPQRRPRQVPHRVELADGAVGVGGLQQRLLVPDPGDERGLLGDHHVDLGPRLGALLRIADQLGLVHRRVDLRHVQLGPVRVALRDDVLAVERRVEDRLSVGEVLAPADVRADRDVGVGTLQKRVYIASCVTSRRRTLKPIFSNCSLATSAAFWATPSDVPTINTSSSPSYLPEAKPAFLKYDAASSLSPSGWDMKSSPGP